MKLIPICFFLSLIASFGGFSQSSQLGKAQEDILRREEQRQRAKQQELQKRFQAKKTVPKLSENEEEKGKCYPFNKITLKNATLLTQKEKNKLTTPYLHQCLSMGKINTLLRKITNLYIEKGYITSRAYLTPQDVKKKHLEILVVEGRIDKINILENGKTKNSGYNAFPTKKDRTLNVRDLEQGLEQINRLTQVKGSMKLTPSKKVGQSTVNIHTQKRRVEYARMSYDNYGQKATGRDQMDLTIGVDDLLGLYESFSLSLRSDVDFYETNNYTRGVSGGFSLPLGYWNINFHGSYFKYFNTINSISQSFESKGISRSYELSLSRVLFRNQASKVSVKSYFKLKDSDNYIEGVRLAVSSRRLSHVGVSANYQTTLWKGSFYSSLSYERGVHFLASLKDKEGLPLGSPKAQADKFTIDLNYYKPFSKLFSTSLQVFYQWSPHTLYGTERVGLGGVYTVSGYREQSLSGDRGGYARVQGLFSLPYFKSLGQLQAYFGYDLGVIDTDDKDAFERGTLQGARLGVKLSASRLLIDLSLEKNINAPSFITESGYTWGLKVSKTF